MESYIEGDEGLLANRRANLLVALLLRYPEIGSVRIDPQKAAITLSFLLREMPLPEIAARFRRQVAQSLTLFSRLEGDRLDRIAAIDLARRGPLARLNLQRDVDTLAAGEFPFLLSLVRRSFGEHLVVDDAQQPVESTGDGEDDAYIVHGLDQARAVRDGEALIGLRNDGRVLVFSGA